VLGTPPAFVLSQDQTLRREPAHTRGREQIVLKEPNRNVLLGTLVWTTLMAWEPQGVFRTCVSKRRRIDVTFVSSTIARRRPNARIGVLCPLFCFQGAVARRHAPIESELVLAGASRTRRFRTLPEGGSVRRRKLYTQPYESCNSVGKIRRICVAKLPSQLQGFWPMACCGKERLAHV
jgi:hypothetical protein